MHEITIAEKIIKDAKVQGNVKSITVEVGDLGHLPAKEMKEVLEKITNWKIIIQKKSAIILCPSCNFQGEPKIIQHMHDHSIYECPKCHFLMPKILEGHNILLKEVEIKK